MEGEPITVGIHEDHNAGVAAVRGGRVLAYCEWERVTREKNQAGWHPDLLAGVLETLPPGELGAVCAPEPARVADLLVERFGGAREGACVRVEGRPVHLFRQDHLHPLFHLLATFTLGALPPDVYAVLVFDAEQPRTGWIDLRAPLSAPPGEGAVRPATAERWFNGEIFAGLFGKLFYGSRDLRHAGKLMGLASWGTPRDGQRAWLEETARRAFDPAGRTWEGYYGADADALRREARERWDADPHDHDPGSAALDLAASAQALFTERLVEEARRGIDGVRRELEARGMPAPRAVLYGGGCALSVVSNGALRTALDLPLIIPPFAHDASQFVGAALWAALCLGRPVAPTAGWDRLPSHTGGAVCAGMLARAGLPHRPADPDEVAGRIAAGQLVALAEGGAEAGPRALGMRSLLADPRGETMRERINHQVKKREWYRPFAPALPAEAFPAYFGEPASAAAAYMLDAYTFRPEHRAALASVSSPGGVARPQAVDAARSPRLHAILRGLERHTGHPVVLNTSLNAPGRTIAYDLRQVVDDCAALGVDAAVLDGMLVEGPVLAAAAARGGWS